MTKRLLSAEQVEYVRASSLSARKLGLQFGVSRSTIHYTRKPPKPPREPLPRPEDGDEWRSVVGFEGLYEVSRRGRIRNCKTGHILTLCPNDNGYYQFHARRIGAKPKTIRVHQAVARAFIENPNGWPDVNHLDLDKGNNAVSNLEWTYDQANQAHAIANKVYCPAHNPKRRHKLSPDQVQEIRALIAAGNLTQKEIAVKFGMSVVQIHRIARGQQWKHLAAA